MLFVVTVVEVNGEYMVKKASEVEVKTFVPRSGVTIHTNDDEAKEAEMQAGSESPAIRGRGRERGERERERERESVLSIFLVKVLMSWRCWCRVFLR